ncbi:MAG: carbon-nitrogen hydrolase family protein [Methanospirillum sp.]|nr:carbon-nitrogen hydrolase family protein [Methanospirillum sp.]
MILCLAQMAPRWNDTVSGLRQMRSMASDAVEGDASFIAFPEQILTGWNPKEVSGTEDEEGEQVSVMREIARDLSIGILGSYRERQTPRPRNTCIAIGPDGKILARYSKIHLFSPGGEDQYYQPGDALGIFSCCSCTIGIAICYDLRFAHLFQLYREQGVHLILVPSAWPASRMKHFHLFTTSRAAEFQAYIASVNTVGVTPVETYNGGSCIAGSDGTVRAMGSDMEELIFCEIDPKEVERSRQAFPVYSDGKKTDYTDIKRK